MRRMPGFGIAIENLVYYCNSFMQRLPSNAQNVHVVAANERASYTVSTFRHYHRKEKSFNSGSIIQTDRFFFWVLRSSSLAGIFHDNVDKSISTRIWLFVERYSSPAFADFLVVICRILSGINRYLLRHALALLLHSWDWLKDVFLAWKIWDVFIIDQETSSSFPLSLFVIIVTSLVVNELAVHAVCFLHPRTRTIQGWSLQFRHMKSIVAKHTRKCCFFCRSADTILETIVRYSKLLVWILTPVAKLHLMVLGIESGHRQGCQMAIA